MTGESVSAAPPAFPFDAYRAALTHPGRPPIKELARLLGTTSQVIYDQLRQADGSLPAGLRDSRGRPPGAPRRRSTPTPQIIARLVELGVLEAALFAPWAQQPESRTRGTIECPVCERTRPREVRPYQLRRRGSRIPAIEVVGPGRYRGRCAECCGTELAEEYGRENLRLKALVGHFLAERGLAAAERRRIFREDAAAAAPLLAAHQVSAGDVALVMRTLGGHADAADTAVLKAARKSQLRQARRRPWRRSPRRIRFRLPAGSIRPRSSRERRPLAARERRHRIYLCPLCELLVFVRRWHPECREAWLDWFKRQHRRWPRKGEIPPRLWPHGPRPELVDKYIAFVAMRRRPKKRTLAEAAGARRQRPETRDAIRKLLGGGRVQTPQAFNARQAAFLKLLPGDPTVMFSETDRRREDWRALVRLPEELAPLAATEKRVARVIRLHSYGMVRDKIARIVGVGRAAVRDIVAQRVAATVRTAPRAATLEELVIRTLRVTGRIRYGRLLARIAGAGGHRATDVRACVEDLERRGLVTVEAYRPRRGPAGRQLQLAQPLSQSSP